MLDTSALVKELRRRNGSATIDQIAFVCGITKQRVSQILTSDTLKRKVSGAPSRVSYETEVAYVRRVIPERGRIWEGARGAYERGEYKSDTIDRMLREGVIVPSPDPDGGYVLPTPTPQDRRT